MQLHRRFAFITAAGVVGAWVVEDSTPGVLVYMVYPYIQAQRIRWSMRSLFIRAALLLRIHIRLVIIRIRSEL